MHTPAERRDAQGRGDVWGLGLTVLALVSGREPLHICTTRSQAEMELFEACKEGQLLVSARRRRGSLNVHHRMRVRCLS